MDVVIYARISSNNQTQQSTEGQIACCKDYAERNNYNVIHIYVDEAKSGKNDKREQFQQMIEESKNKTFQGVLVYQFDRFARNRYDSAKYKTRLKKNGVKVISAKETITDDPTGVIVESFLEGMAEYYSLDLGLKVKRGMGTNAEKCFYNGGSVPLGLKIKSIPLPLGAKGKTIYKKKYDIDEEKAPIVKRIFEMYNNGNTMADIIRYLNKIGLKTSKGKEFNKNSIRTIILNKKYIGIYSYNGKETPNAIPQIIDEDTFYKAQERLLKNKQAPARTRAKAEYLLTTKLFCGTCRDMMVGVSGRSGNGTQHCYYSCKNTLKHKCTRKNIKKDYIEDLVVNLARSELTDKNINELASSVYKTASKKQDTIRVKALQREILNKDKQKQNLVNSLTECDIPEVRKTIFTKLNEIEQSKKEIENQIKEEQSNLFLFSEKDIKYFLKNLQNGNENDMKYRQMIIDVLIYEVYVYDDDLTIVYSSNGKSVKVKIPTIEDIEHSLKAEKSLNCSNKGKNAQPNVRHKCSSE